MSTSFLKELVNLIDKRLPINAAYFCPHTLSADCSCRKPRTQMISEYRKSYPNSIDIEFFIGDTEADRICAKNLEIEFTLMLHEHNSHLRESNCRQLVNFKELNL